MEREQGRLASALKAVADADAGRSAPAAVEERLRQQVRAQGSASRGLRRAGWLVAAAAAVVVGAFWWTLPRPVPPGEVATPIASDQQTNQPSAFLPLPYAHVPVSDGRVVRMEVSGAALAAFGLEPVAVEAGDVVLADVFVGEDGLARAVRFVRPDELIQEQMR